MLLYMYGCINIVYFNFGPEDCFLSFEFWTAIIIVFFYNFKRTTGTIIDKNRYWKLAYQSVTPYPFWSDFAKVIYRGTTLLLYP